MFLHKFDKYKNKYLTKDIIYFIYRELKHFVKHDVINDVKDIYACLYYNRNCPENLKEIIYKIIPHT